MQYILDTVVPLLVALVSPPKPRIRAVWMALFPLPFLPLMKLMRGLNTISKWSWHMKFFTLIDLTTPAVPPVLDAGWLCTSEQRDFFFNEKYNKTGCSFIINKSTWNLFNAYHDVMYNSKCLAGRNTLFLTSTLLQTESSNLVQFFYSYK